MLAATDRLRRRDEFSATVAGGRRAARGAVVVHAASRLPMAVEPLGAEASVSRIEQNRQMMLSTSNPARNLAKPSVRAGFVVSKAVGGAVVRNRVRRRLRHLMRSRLDQLPDRTDVVVRALPSAANRTYAALGADLDGALSTIVKDAIRPARPRRRGRS